MQHAISRAPLLVPCLPAYPLAETRLISLDGTRQLRLHHSITRHLQANSGSSAFRWVGILVVITAAILALTAQAHHNRRMMMRLDYALALVERSHNLSNSTNANIGVDKWELPGEGGQPAGKEEQQAVAEAGPLGCRASGYCSLGKSKVWRGDIATNAALLEMLQAVAYKKEVSGNQLVAQPRQGWLSVNMVKTCALLTIVLAIQACSNDLPWLASPNAPSAGHFLCEQLGGPASRIGLECHQECRSNG
jgi:hypothetical protein